MDSEFLFRPLIFFNVDSKSKKVEFSRKIKTFIAHPLFNQFHRGWYQKMRSKKFYILLKFQLMRFGI